MADGIGILMDCLLDRAVLPDDGAVCDRLFCLADRHHVLAALALAVQDRGDGKRADILANAMVQKDDGCTLVIGRGFRLGRHRRQENKKTYQDKKASHHPNFCLFFNA